MARFNDPQTAVDLVTESAEAFTQTLIDVGEIFEGDMSKIIKKVVTDLFRRIAERTPVDTGRAKGNWSLGAQTTETEEDITTPSQATRRITEKLAEFGIDLSEDDEIWIYNNVKYIEVLENGSSRQAPAGMVALSLVEFDYHLQQAIAPYSYLEAT